jgi:hypothetical protein
MHALLYSIVRKQPPGMILAIANAYPAAAKVRNNFTTDKNLPIYILMKNATNANEYQVALITLLGANLEQIKTKNDHPGKLLLHCALDNPLISADVIAQLSECYPESVKERFNGHLPIYIAFGNKASEGVISTLM